MPTPSPALPIEQQVSASSLVRRFGHWQDRAARAPVYILHHGRPRWVLTSLELMTSLCAPRPENPEAADAIIVLDALAQPILLVDKSETVSHVNAAARALFGQTVAAGATAHGIVRDDDVFLTHAIRRVLASGTGEKVEIAPARFPARRMNAVVMPSPGGCAIMLEDITVREELVGARALLAATEAAIQAVGRAATATIGLRGQITDCGTGLPRLCEIADERLIGARLPTIFTPATRVAIADGVEAAMAGTAQRIEAELLVGGASPLAVTVGLSPVRGAGDLGALVASIVAAA